MTIKVEMSRSPDAQALATIHNACFEGGWDEQAIADLLAVGQTRAFTAGGKGFSLLRHLDDDAEILTLAVLPEHRRNGVALALVNAMCGEARKQGAKALLLEVSEVNAAACGLYEKAGFITISRRKEYYRRPDGTHEHALVMRRAL